MIQRNWTYPCSYWLANGGNQNYPRSQGTFLLASPSLSLTPGDEYERRTASSSSGASFFAHERKTRVTGDEAQETMGRRMIQVKRSAVLPVLSFPAFFKCKRLGVRQRGGYLYFLFYCIFFKSSLFYHLSFLVDVFNSGFCKMYIIITNVSEPGLKINPKGM